MSLQNEGSGVANRALHVCPKTRWEHRTPFMHLDVQMGTMFCWRLLRVATQYD